MSWAKIDDRFLMNPKVMSAGLEGRALYLAGILYCAGELTDGKIPAGAVRKLAALSDVEDAAAATERLISLNLWEPADDGGYLIHDYLEYNPAGEKVRSERSAAKERMSRHRSPEVLANNVRSSSSPSPSPSLSNPKECVKKHTPESEPVRVRCSQSDFEEFWQAFPNKKAKDDAWKAWQKLSPDSALRATLLLAIVKAKDCDQWQRNIIPHPATWLNGRRWCDELQPPPGTNPPGYALPTPKSEYELCFDEESQAFVKQRIKIAV